MNVGQENEERRFNDLEPLKQLSVGDYQRAIEYVEPPIFYAKIEAAIEEGRRDLDKLRSNPFRNCMPGCYV
ncbi:hypothetical protein J4423_01205 [Candidatus Pacearchaeota archaeon]|nr:hypothetical protein [Candidatus Pacearchaeota archaeon]